MGELELQKDPTLKDFQEYVKNLEKQRGFADIFIYVCAIANTCSFSTYFATLHSV